jgi:hypothetical protein
MIDSSITIVQGIRGSGKTSYYCKNEFRNTRPLFIVDIRNEYSHIPKFKNVEEFVYHYLSGKPSNQHRFAFTARNQYETIFRLFAAFQSCTLVIDEADALFSMREFERPLIDVFLGSRNNNINMIFVAKRPFLIPIIVRSQADLFVIFKTEEKRDIDYLSNRLRTQWPKDPYKLDKGEAIIYKQGQEPKIQRFTLFNPNESNVIPLIKGESK